MSHKFTAASIADDVWSLLEDDIRGNEGVTVHSEPRTSVVTLTVGAQSFQIDVTEMTP